MSKIMLLDGNNLINRAFYAIPLLSDNQGRYTNAVYGFLNIFFKLIDEEKPEYLACVFDHPSKTFRHNDYAEYKAHRKHMPQELREQFPTLKNLLSTMNIKIFEIEGYEADDVLGSIAVASEKKGLDVVLVSGDKDMLQLASNCIKIKMPRTKHKRTTLDEYYENDVILEFGVSPKEYIEVKALMGDSSDNIKGVPGIGEKTALKLISNYKSIDNILCNIENIKPEKIANNIRIGSENLIKSRRLCTIITDIEIKFNLEDLKLLHIYNERSHKELKRLSFKTFITRLKTETNNNDESEQEKTNIINIHDKQLAKQLITKLSKEELISIYPLSMAVKLKLKKSKQGDRFILNNDDITECIMNKSNNKLYLFNRLSMIFCKHIINKTTETYEDDILIGIGVGAKDEKSFFFSINDNLTEQELMNLISPLLTSDNKKIFLNAKKALHTFQTPITNIAFDVGLASYLINPQKIISDYAELSHEYLNKSYSEFNEIFGKLKTNNLTSDDISLYAGKGANVIFKCYSVMNKLLKDNNQVKLYYQVELPLVSVLFYMEKLGIRVDEHQLITYGKYLDTYIQKLEDDIYNLAGSNDFNINSSSQLSVILFEKLKLPYFKKTSRGYSTAADVLHKLIHKHPIVNKILEYRTYTKLKSTYVDGLLAQINKDTKRIYSTFNQTTVATGRISSTEPNLQNIPIKLELGRQLRKVFIPQDDFVFLDADYSQIELRVLAHMSLDPTLIQAFNDGIDIHAITAARMFGINIDDITKEQRTAAKAINFGIIYGMGAFSLSSELGITVDKAELYIKEYFYQYPTIKNFLHGKITETRQKGYVETILHRRRYIKDLDSSNFTKRQAAERITMNMPIQGSAADIIKIAMVKVYNALKNMESRLILQVHDELLLEVKKTELTEVTNILRQSMEGAMNLSVKLIADISIGDNWLDAK